MNNWRIGGISINCHEASRLSAAAEEQELTRLERWGLWIHLFICGECRRFRDQMQFLRQIVASAPEKFLAVGFARCGRLSAQRAYQIKALLRQAAEQE